jgi:hypothetical protein
LGWGNGCADSGINGLKATLIKVHCRGC